MSDRQQKYLSSRQLAVVEDLFTGEMGEKEVLAKHGLGVGTYRKWLEDDLFANELAFRIESARLQGRLIIARYAPVAASKLVQLTESEKEETARKACLDIISLPIGEKRAAEPEKEEEGGEEKISQKTASKLLEVLAEEEKR